MENCDNMENLEKEIEKIKKSLIDYDSHFKVIFCDHEWEQMSTFDEHSTSGQIMIDNYKCKKCKVIKSEIESSRGLRFHFYGE